MAETSIEWTDRSINPIRARHRKTGAIGHYCELYSSGCAHCYASNFQKRFTMPPFPGRGRSEKLPVLDDRDCVIVNEDIELFLDESKLQEVLTRRKPCKWFWCDMTDMFGSWVPDQWIDRCFAVMHLTAQHTHQVLTKRASRLCKYMKDWPIGMARGHHIALRLNEAGDGLASIPPKHHPSGSFSDGTGPTVTLPLSNAWLGVSAENQETFDKRHGDLGNTPAAVRYLSLEPLLGPIDVAPFCESFQTRWVIVGGESGRDARPCRLAWVRDIVRQCADYGVACFVKQLGSNAEEGFGVNRKLGLKHYKGGDPSEWPADLRVREFPEARAVA